MEKNELSKIFLKIAGSLTKSEMKIWNDYRTKLWNKMDFLNDVSRFPSIDEKWGKHIREAFEIMEKLPTIRNKEEISY